MLAGRVVIVTGGDGGIGRALALGLADAGASVAIVAPLGADVVAEPTSAGAVSIALGCGFDSRVEIERAFAAVAAALGPVDVVVHALLDPAAFAPAPLAEIGAAGWDAGCESVLRLGVWCAQAAFTSLSSTGGRIIFVTPTVGLTGGAGLVKAATAVEGLRALAKSAARQWGANGITVNCVAPPVETLSPEPTTATHPVAASGVPALGRLPDARTDVAPVVAMLAAATGHFVTGATVVVDGGTVMAP